MNARELLIEVSAHAPPHRVLEALSGEDAERRTAPSPHSIAEIVAHLVFWQEWFRQRCEGEAEPLPAAASLGWPAVSAGSWDSLRGAFFAGLDRLAALAEDPRRLRAAVAPPIELPAMARYTIGEALTHVASHNAYHLGQVVLLRQALGSWPPPSGGWTW